MRLRAHRDELISLENELGEKLQLKSDGSLFKTLFKILNFFDNFNQKYYSLYRIF